MQVVRVERCKSRHVRMSRRERSIDLMFCHCILDVFFESHPHIFGLKATATSKPKSKERHQQLASVVAAVVVAGIIIIIISLVLTIVTLSILFSDFHLEE